MERKLRDIHSVQDATLVWSGSIKGATISFHLDEVHFVKETSQKLNCKLSDYHCAMRVIITSRFGYSVNTLQANAAVMRSFADKLEVPTDYPSAQLLADLLVLLPGNSEYRAAVLNQIDDIPALGQRVGMQQRHLSHYQSYLRLLDLFDRFWGEATASERILFFPIWFWLKITGVLPLRPTECILTPRHCIRQGNDKYYLTVRRTRLKGTHQGSLYSIDSDYEFREYPIPEYLAQPILEYVSSTQATYKSDIDVLFCKSSQFAEIDVTCPNDNHYTYANLHQCLDHFYREVIRGKFGMDIVSDKDWLLPGEIEKINLGDTRHIAMVSLAISGGSPTICRELAGHESIEISSHYYTNLTEFLDVLGYERFRIIAADVKKAYGITVNRQYPVEGGYCQCEQVLLAPTKKSGGNAKTAA